MEHTQKIAIDPKAKFELDGKHYSGETLSDFVPDALAVLQTIGDMVKNIENGDASPGAVVLTVDILLRKIDADLCVVVEFISGLFNEGVEVANDES